MSAEPIAIVGVAGCFAGAADATQLWNNVLNKVDATSEADAAWASLSRDNDPESTERLYTTRGGFLKELASFDAAEFGIMPRSIDGADPDHYLGLRLARDALSDAGLLDKDFDRSRAGIIVGRGGYAYRGTMTLAQHGLVLDQTLAAIAAVRPDFSAVELKDLREALRAQLPAFNAEATPGFVSNIATGLIANRLDLMGPNYVVDAACASSLLAVEAAVRELQTGRCDVMLCGGSQVQTGAQIFMSFCNINALSRERVRPFSKGSSGTLLGEGAGFLALKRLSDAEADGDRVYALIRGIGVASDGRAKGVLAPRLEGEELALRRAYENAQVSPDTVSLIEAHGTGMPLGDRTEIQALSRMFGPRHGELPTIAIGSIKSMISHCIPASGSASMIKTALALHHKVLPPTLCDELEPELGLERTPFYVNTETRPWIHGGREPRRAGVNAFGFGGINAHVVLEEYRPARKVQAQVLHAPSEGELLVLAADSLDELRARVDQLVVRASAFDQPGLPSLARLCAQDDSGSHRLALVAADRDDLLKKLAQAAEKLARGDAPFKTRNGIYYGNGEPPGRVAFLFPGEGAQYPNMLSDVCVQFPQARDWFDFLDDTAAARGAPARAPVLFPAPTALGEATAKALEARLYEMDVAAESVFAASMALLAVVDAVDLKPDLMLGHSTGENTALTASGVRRFSQRSEIAQTIRDLNDIYKQLDQEGRIVGGSLLTIGALRPEQREALLSAPPRGIIPAMDNCPNQLVLFGDSAAIGELRAKLSAEGAICQELPFGRAYHTELFGPVADAYRHYYENIEFGAGRVPLYSACSAGPFPEDAPGIRALASKQWEAKVRFTETVERLYADGVRVFVEIGPSGNLTSFVSDALRGREELVAVASNSRRRSGVQQLNHMLAQLFSCGVPLRMPGLFAHRQIADIDWVAPAIPRRKPAILNLNMPELRVPDAFRGPPPQASTPQASNPVAGNVPAAAAPPLAAPPATDVTDPRGAALRAHFSLMNDFLASQMRVMSQLGQGSPPALPLATPAVQVPAMVAKAEAVTPGYDPAYPMLGRIVAHEAGRLESRRRYDADTDLYLRDHAIGSAPSVLEPDLRALQVMPFTFSMEIASEAARRLVGDGFVVRGHHEVRGHRWLTLDEDHLDLRIVATRAPGASTVGVRLFMLGSGMPPDGLVVFETEVLLGQDYEAPPQPLAWPDEPSQIVARHDDSTLYSQGMFHGPRLRCVKHVRRWSATAVECDLAAHDTYNFFSFTSSPRMQTDAALLDAVGQMAGYWLIERFGWDYNCFPFRCERFGCYGPPPAPGTRLIGRGRIHPVGDTQLHAEFDLIHENGTVLMRLEGWQDRKFDVPQRYFNYRLQPQRECLSVPLVLGAGVYAVHNPAFPEGFLGVGHEIWMRVLAHMMLSSSERKLFNAMPRGGGRRADWLMGRVAAKDAVRHWAAARGLNLSPADVDILNADNGRPYVRCAAISGTPPVVSLSHSGGGAVAVAADAGHEIGIDLQRLHDVDVDALIRGGMHAREAALVEPLDAAMRLRATVALWSAKEAAAKAAGLGLDGRPLEWVVTELQLAIGSGSARVLHASREFLVSLHFLDEESVIAVVAPPTQHTPRSVSMR